jgi:hypothetical protein
MDGRPGPLVSVVIPSHNYAHFLGEAIQSALDQGYRPIEIIVVDDGSTDDTPAVLGRFAGRVQALRLDGVGVSAARNAGLARATGEYVIFLDADDLLAPGGVAAQVAQGVQDPDLGVVVGAWYVCDTRLGTTALVRSPLRPGSVLPQLLQGNIVTTPSAVMVRRQPLAAAGGFDASLSFTADWEMWIRLARAGVRFAAVETPVAVYRIHAGSMTRNLAKAVQDVTTVHDRCFGDASLDAEARAVEPRARAAMAQYLARQAAEQGDVDRTADLLRQALAYQPAAGDSLEFYHGMARALWRREQLHGRRDLSAAAAALPALIGVVDPAAGLGRQALGHLAVGMVARSAGAWGQAVRALVAALLASPKTTLARPQVAEAVRLLVPLWLTRALRALLERAGLRPGAPPLPPMVSAMARAHGDRGS